MCHKGLEIISLDEVGDLTQAFNDLQSTIHSYHQQLDAANNKMLEMERQQKEIMRALFSNYVSPKIVEELLKTPDGTKLGGERRNITVLFCDIREFTSISEKLSPEEVVTGLNEYFMEASEIIFKWDGTLDKFIGDAVLAFWGAPTDQINQTELSVRCALDMSKRLLQLQRKWAEKGKVIFECGMGITSGNAIVGNVGSLGKKMDYTAIGNCVNLCSRLQSLSKEHKAGIFVTEEIMQYIQSALTCRQLGHCAFRKIGPIRVRGKEKEVIIYALDDLPHGV
jgi:adenylate cyclase